jgi:hypothetical protein
MVVFLDLEDTDAEPPEQSNHWFIQSGRGQMGGMRSFGEGQDADKEAERENPNRDMGITKALGCYP